MRRKRKKNQRKASEFSRRELRLIDSFVNNRHNDSIVVGSDDRRFDPTANHPVLDDGRPSRIVYHPNKNRNKSSVPSRLSFADSKKTVVCQRRFKRREVLFSKKKIGKGLRVSPKRIYNHLSSIICRRSRS